MKQVNYPSIKGFEGVIRTVNHSYAYLGMDEKGEPTYDRTRKKPKITFKGTVKLHGTNASIAMDATDYWAQSRERIIVVGDDNAGFAGYALANKSYFSLIIQKLADENLVDLNSHVINIYGEWAGRGIPGGSAGIRKFPKGFYIFGAKVSVRDFVREEGSEITEDPNAYWIDHSWISNHSINTYNITEFPMREVEIDFKYASEEAQKLMDATLEVERDCPVSRQLFNSSSPEYIAEYEEGYFNEFIGEGLVWRADYQGNKLIFKSKGLLHAPGTKIKELKTKDIEEGKLIREVAEYVTPEWRLDQFLVSVFDLGNEGILDVKLLGKYIQEVMKDVYKEESEYIATSGLQAKQINGSIGIRAREYFFERQAEELKALDN